MSELRQFCPQMPGAVLANYQPPGTWDVVAAGDYGGLGCCFFQTQQLDLRGLMAGNEQGLFFDSISLQENRLWSSPVQQLETGWFIVYDMLTTVEPTEHTIAETFVRPDTGTSVGPGFLFGADVLSNEWPPSEQTLNPSQVIWGIWRAYVQAMDYKAPEAFGIPYNILQSGYFGQGDYAVSPALWWTRIVLTCADEAVVVCPSANLLTNARAEKITVPQELSQMMRAAQR